MLAENSMTIFSLVLAEPLNSQMVTTGIEKQ